MDVLLQRARSFASEAAKRSQDLAKEAAKISQEIALETAKRSKEIATEASKKADQLKALAGDINIGIPSSSSSSSTTTTTTTTTTTSTPSSESSESSEEELLKYGITPEVREFAHGLTISTFQDFPSEDFDSDAKDEFGTSNVRQDLTEWQERHALLVLKAVPEISQFRYELCPRLMKEKRFWKIYFTLVRSHVVLYEAPAIVPEDILGNQHIERASAATLTMNEAVEKSEAVSKVAEATEKKRAIDDQDLDAYLLGDVDSDGDGEDVGFDPEFDQLVNSSALDSDIEEETHDSKMASSLSAKASEGSSDGELV